MDQQNDTNLVLTLHRAFYWLDVALQNQLGGGDAAILSRAQLMVILTIGKGVHRPSQMAEQLAVSRQAVHQTIKELVSLKLVEAHPDPNDKRAKRIVLGARGDLVYAQAAAAVNHIEAGIESKIGPRKFKQLRDALAAEWE